MTLIAFFDPPLVINCAVTPIPASSSPPLQVIANSGTNTSTGMYFSDTTGDFIGVYTGPAGFEILACVIGNGVTSTSVGSFPRNSRVSLRSMANVTITSGQIQGALVSL